MRITWRESKRRRNLRDHRIDFADAQYIWRDVVVEDVDDREDYGEDRWTALGQVAGRVLLVVYTTPDDDTIHLVSARRATSDEEALYWQAYPR